MGELSVALVGRFFAPHPAGAEVSTRRLGQALTDAGVPCEVVTTRVSSERAPARLEGGLHVRRLRTVRGRLSQPVDFGRAFLFFVLHGGRFTIVQADCLSAFSLGAILGGRIRGLRTIVGTCTAEPDGDIARVRRAPLGALAWRLFRKADVMSAQTPAIAEGLHRSGVARRRIVELARFVPIASEPLADRARRAGARAALGIPDQPSVLFVGRLTEAKGVDVLLDAWAILGATRSVSLLLVGDGPLAERASAMASRYPGAPIVVAGVRSDIDLWSDAADIFAFPSRSEAFGVALCEAMGRGLAVVATPTGFVNNGFEDGVHGRVVPIGDAAALAAAIEELLLDDDARASMGVVARAFVAARFAPRISLAAHVALYRRLMSESRT